MNALELRTGNLAHLLLVLALAGCSSAREGVRTAEHSAGTPGPSKRFETVTSVTAGELRDVVRDSQARVVLVNVWATWCQPCLEEFPDLLRIEREYRGRGVKLILVSGDFDTEVPNVVKFLSRQGVDFPTYIKAGSDMEFINTMNSEWSGALPATFVYDSGGHLARFWEGKASYAELQQAVFEVLKDQTDGMPQ